METKDDFMQFYVVSKVEAKKIIKSEKFEEVVNRFWSLMRQSPDQDLDKMTISKDQYKRIMQCIYKVILPIYREDEMNSEIDQEWMQDSSGHSELTLHLFTKLLFRVAHQWAVHINIDEYVELLNKIYNRITVRKVIKSKSGQAIIAYPTIQVEIIPPEVEGGPDPFLSSEDTDLVWEPCMSDEEENSKEFEYHYFENLDTLTVKKHKRRKQITTENEDNHGAIDHIPMFPPKEPVTYREEVIYHQNNGDYRPVGDDYVSYVLADLCDIFPFGYLSEQFLTWLKNDVHQKYEESKKAKKEAYAKMQRDALDGQGIIKESNIKKETDGGLIAKFSGKFINKPFPFVKKENSKVRARYKIVDALYNALRVIQKDSRNLQLRLHFSNPTNAVKNAKQKAPKGSLEPITEVNKFGYNPALERRIQYKMLPIFSKQPANADLKTQIKQYININYLLNHPDFITAYRCDVDKYENSKKLNIKRNDEFKRDEHFTAVECSYKKIRNIMLQKKFESIFTDNLNADEIDQKRMDQIVERENGRLKSIRNPEPLHTKGVSEENFEKSLIKIMQGPFYKLISKNGLVEENFIKIPQNDLIEYANTSSHRIMIIGKPRSGKTTLAKNLAVRLDLVHVSVENWLLKLQEKIKNYEPPEDLEEDQQPPEWLTPLEKSCNESMKNGQGQTEDQVIEILREEIQSPLAKTKGYVLDLTFFKASQPWAKLIRMHQILGQNLSNGTNIEFSHVIEIEYEDDEIRQRAAGMRLDPKDGIVYSKWEVTERNKPKPVQYDENGDIIEEPEPSEGAEESGSGPIDVDRLIQRVEDTPEYIDREIDNWHQIEKQQLDDLMVRLYNHQYLKLECAGLTPDEIADSAEWRVRSDRTIPLRPIAQQLEGGGDFKAILVDPLIEDQPEGVLPRQFSLWQQTDPVALFNKQVIQGQPENAVAYANNMFVFNNEENMKAFMTEPKKYLKNPPKMPQTQRFMMVGPKGIGVHTQAQNLSKIYGWKVVDFQQMVKSRLMQIINKEFLPNNVEPAGRSQIGLSLKELEDIKTGKPFPSWKFIPWILDYLGYQLQKKPPPPPPEVAEEEPVELTEEEQSLKEKENKKKKLEEAKRLKAEEEERVRKAEKQRKREEAMAQGLNLAELGLEESEEEEIIEDLSIDDLCIKLDDNGKPYQYIGGFILLGFPQTQVHAEKLKEHGIEFDRILHLKDMNEDEEWVNGQEVVSRMKQDLHYNWEQENEKANKIIEYCKEVFTEEVVADINATGSQDDVLIKIRQTIDPFYIRVDNPDDVRVSADLDEDARKLPKGDFGDFCPVTYVEDNFLQKGNPEIEATVYGKTYWFAGEKELEKFKFNPNKYLITLNGKASIPLKPPMPKIMVLGMKGSGITTQIDKICDKYKLDSFSLKDEFIKKLNSEKESRKRRRLLDRGFRPPIPNEDEEDPMANPLPDPEIEDDPDDFDREKHEQDVMRKIILESKGLIMDGTWNGFAEDQVVANEGGAFANLLIESRRAPELVIILKCNEQNAFDRLIDEKATRELYEKLMKERDEKIKSEREQARAEKLKELQDEKAAENADAEEDAKKPESEIQAEIEEAMKEWDDNRDQEEADADENDEEKPNFDEMMEKHREDIRTQREADEGFLEEFSTTLKERGIPVLDDIKTDISAEFVFVKMNARLSDHIQLRTDLIEKQQASPLTEAELPFFEQSYQFRQSKFGKCSPLNPSNPIKSRKYPVLYRERIYYPVDQDERETFLKKVSKYALDTPSIPLDVRTVPKISILGYQNSGKTTLAKKISEATGAVHITIEEIVQTFIDRDCVVCEQLRRFMKQDGKSIDEAFLTDLIFKRTQMKDCLENGWILEDYPQTKEQAIYMAKSDLQPTNVFYIRIPQQEVYQRTQDQSADQFECMRTIVAHRLRYLDHNLPHVLGFYSRVYNNLIEIDGLKSVWFMEDRALSSIQSNIESRQNFSTNLFHSKPCYMQDTFYDRCIFKASLSQFGYYCPVTWKNRKQLVKCTHNPEMCVYFDNLFYYFKGPTERNMFMENPRRFINNIIFSSNKGIPIRYKHHKAAEISAQEKAILGYCPVTLVDEGRVCKGDSLLVVQYKDNKFQFESEYKLQMFLMTPFRYNKAELPVKMPPHEEPVSLYALQASPNDDSTTFIEQALGSIVTRGLREVSENRLRYPNISVKETMLKLFALYLKAENPANTEFMSEKYRKKMRLFIERCEMAEELDDLAQERKEKQEKNKWPEFKEKYYQELGDRYDAALEQSLCEIKNGFCNYLK